MISTNITAFEQAVALDQLCARVGYSLDWAQVLDLNHLASIVIAALKKHVRFCTKAKLTARIFAKSKAYGVWRKIPFLDTPAYFNYVQENGLPRIQSSVVMAPSGTDTDSLRPLGDTNELPPESPKLLVAVIPFLIDILNAMGVGIDGIFRNNPSVLTDVSDDDFMHFFGAANRANAATIRHR